MQRQISILGFAGSLRAGSYNKALLNIAREMTPVDSSLDIFDLEGIPLFNQDQETQPPDRVRLFKNKIKAADAILVASPEHNYSIPGVLKNAVDWASRPFGDNSFEGKPVAVMSASIGMLGGSRAQYHLRQSFVYLNMHPLNRPEVMVPFAQQKVDASGGITDDTTRKKVAELVEALVIWTRKLAGCR
jgi:chromate reductase, NAD(P)H dehydrogenase (quinone)